MKKTFLILFFLTSLSCCLPQRTTYKINYYSPRDYGKGREATNLACVQSKNGVLYFGNAGGLLQYDGVSWSFIPVKNQSVWIESLAVSDENVIYVGAQSEFGYLAPDESGRLSYISLSDQLTNNQKSFSSIIRLWTWKNNVAFQFEEAIFLYSNGKLTTILPETSFHISFLINDELYVRQRGIGIMKLTGNNLQLVKGSGFLKDSGVFSMLESSEPGRYIIITREDGFWSVNKNTFKGSLIKTEDSTKFKQSEVYGAIRLKDGNIALNTLSNGIIITDDTFKVLSVINKDNGLKVNGVLSLLQDYQGNIWAGLDNGIAQVHYSSPVSVFGPETGISGNVKAIVRYNGNLYIGTTAGLFVQNYNYKMLSAAFVPFGAFSKEIISLCLADGCLSAGTRDELFEIKNNEINKIENIEINALYYSEKLKILFVSTKNDLNLYVYSGKWKKLKDIPEITEEVVRFEEAISKENVTLWMGTSLKGIVRLQFTSPLDYKVDKYNSSDGLIDDSWVLPFKIDNNVVFSQRNGLLSFVDEKTIQDQLPDSLKNRLEFYKGYFDFISIDSSKESISQPFYVVEDTKERIYVNLDGDLGYFDKADSYSFVKQPFCLSNIGKINVVLHEDNGICWIGGDDGLLMFNENSFKNYEVDFNTLITRVSCGGRDSVLYCGYSDYTGHIQNNEAPVKKFIINHNLNTVSFTFAAPFFEGQEKMLYSYMLHGQDTTYSQWSTDNRVVFRNLWEGDYTFKVRAMNAYGHVSSEKDFGFRVLSPWYRKIWAYIIYVLLISAVIYAGIRINTRRLVALNKKLENIIRERTLEIHEKNIELEKQKEDILDSINYAQRIQNAVLPTEDLIQLWLGDHFILFRPKDIVSGDFYWTTIYNQYTFFCVADCTGHGVPGAFMSMLCISFLNEIVLKEEVVHPEKILNKVRIMIIESLRQKGLSGEQKDGMDISICVFNKETSKLEFSGANNPLYIIRKKDNEPVPCYKQLENEDYILYEIKGDRMPISIYDRMDSFKRHTINLLKNDRLYLFSDGICDQFGGPNARRFMNNALKAALMETLTPEIKDQKQHLENRIDEWQAFINPKTGHSFDQVDDICLMGIKI
jgi:serine phosphatase RsbU (regulator of sigma subunit)